MRRRLFLRSHNVLSSAYCPGESPVEAITSMPLTRQRLMEAYIKPLELYDHSPGYVRGHMLLHVATRSGVRLWFTRTV